MKRRWYIVIILISAVISVSNAQVADDKSKEHGYYNDRITDADGNPLSGIRVRVRGKGVTTVTDANGEFSIKASFGDIIILSKNGKTIDTYRYDRRLNYEIKDESGVLNVPEKKSKAYRFSKISPSKQDGFKVQLDSALLYSNSNPTKSIDFIGSALNFAGNNRSQLSQSYDVLGDVYMNLKQYDLAADNYKIANDNQPEISTQLKLARAYLLNGKYNLSENQFKSLLQNRSISTVQKVAVYEGLGDVFFSSEKYEQALSEFRTALNLNERISNLSKRTSLNSKIASSLDALGRAGEAEGYLNRSIQSAEAESPRKAVIQNQKAADFYSKNNSLDKEVQLRKKTLETLEDEALDEVVIEEDVSPAAKTEKITKSRAKLDLGNAYLKQNKLNEAIPLLEESAADAEKDADLETQKEAVEKLSEAYVSLGDDNKALTNYKKYVSLVDVLYKQKEKEISDAINLNRSLSEKQNRITSLEKDRALSDSKLQLYQAENQLTIENDRRQKLTIYGLLIGLVLLLLSLFWMMRSNRQRKLANNLLALKSLRTQMNPHFIFNALNSVNSFIAQNDERSANRYLSEFSTLMRSVLINSEEDFIPLEKEIELLELYLKLEHSRFQDKFDYELIVDNEIDQEQFQIPPMLLQPYVENAVWHGLRYKEEKGFLKVALSKKDEEIISIEISDNGIGRRKSKELKTEHQKKQQSKGMQNIKQRIKILNEMYKDKVDVFIEDLYDDTTGTKVILTLKKD
ncbi:MAG: histidine kinase [Flavobacteriaceae bacterium]|nr:histidine kinase [Flavobacteriaceae bacterium]